MISTEFRIHHIGLIVHDIEQALDFYRSTCGYEEMPRESLAQFNAEIAFLLPKSPTGCDREKTPLNNAPLNNTNLTAIELLQPLKQEGALWKFLEKRGEGLHHIGYEVADITREHARLSAAGLHFIDEKPRPGAHGSTVAFIHPKSCHGVLTELVQPARRQHKSV